MDLNGGAQLYHKLKNGEKTKHIDGTIQCPKCGNRFLVWDKKVCLTRNCHQVLDMALKEIAPCSGMLAPAARYEWLKLFKEAPVRTDAFPQKQVISQTHVVHNSSPATDWCTTTRL